MLQKIVSLACTILTVVTIPKVHGLNATKNAIGAIVSGKNHYVTGYERSDYSLIQNQFDVNIFGASERDMSQIRGVLRDLNGVLSFAVESLEYMISQLRDTDEAIAYVGRDWSLYSRPLDPIKMAREQALYDKIVESGESVDKTIEFKMKYPIRFNDCTGLSVGTGYARVVQQVVCTKKISTCGTLRTFNQMMNCGCATKSTVYLMKTPRFYYKTCNFYGHSGVPLVHDHFAELNGELYQDFFEYIGQGDEYIPVIFSNTDFEAFSQTRCVNPFTWYTEEAQQSTGSCRPNAMQPMDHPIHSMVPNYPLEVEIGVFYNYPIRFSSFILDQGDKIDVKVPNDWCSTNIKCDRYLQTRYFDNGVSSTEYAPQNCPLYTTVNNEETFSTGKCMYMYKDYGCWYCNTYDTSKYTIRKGPRSKTYMSMINSLFRPMRSQLLPYFDNGISSVSYSFTTFRPSFGMCKKYYIDIPGDRILKGILALSVCGGSLLVCRETMHMIANVPDCYWDVVGYVDDYLNTTVTVDENTGLIYTRLNKDCVCDEIGDEGWCLNMCNYYPQGKDATIMLNGTDYQSFSEAGNIFIKSYNDQDIVTKMIAGRIEEVYVNISKLHHEVVDFNIGALGDMAENLGNEIGDQVTNLNDKVNKAVHKFEHLFDNLTNPIDELRINQMDYKWVQDLTVKVVFGLMCFLIVIGCYLLLPVFNTCLLLCRRVPKEKVIKKEPIRPDIEMVSNPIHQDVLIGEKKGLVLTKKITRRMRNESVSGLEPGVYTGEQLKRHLNMDYIDSDSRETICGVYKYCIVWVKNNAGEYHTSNDSKYLAIITIMRCFDRGALVQEEMVADLTIKWNLKPFLVDKATYLNIEVGRINYSMLFLH